MSDPTTNLAEQALDNLVNQFARPLDFLRELVQNSIDAGSPRIEVRIEYDPPKDGQTQGVTRIHVDDWGEGMDQAVIEQKLTRLFESNKEGDLTKIGKFGIGFTSIFAIRPEAVLLETGKHGEHWEVLFHRDRSFELRPLERPIDGTKITLYKRMDRSSLDKFVEEARFILTYWCEHSNVPISFWDRTSEEQVEPVVSDDPFAAFEEAEAPTHTGPEQVNRPLDAEADISIRIIKDDVEAVVGIANQPLYGYYNGGLTLLRTRNVDALGSFAPQLHQLAFKVKNDALEHTLTRDNVLHDDHWERVMTVLIEGRLQLVDALIERIAAAITEGAEPGRWQEHLAVLCDEDDVRARVMSAQVPLLRSGTGAPLTLAKATQSSGLLGIGPILIATHDVTLTEGLADLGVELVEDSIGTRAILAATESPSLFGVLSSHRTLLPADEVFVRPQLLESDALEDHERRLVKDVEELIVRAAGNKIAIRVGDFGGAGAGASEALCLNGPWDGGVFQRPGNGRWRWLKSFLLTRCLLINRHHPLFRSQLLAATEHPWLAAAGLASALFAIEDIEGERTHRTLLHLANARFASEAAR